MCACQGPEAFSALLAGPPMCHLSSLASGRTQLSALHRAPSLVHPPAALTAPSAAIQRARRRPKHTQAPMGGRSAALAGGGALASAAALAAGVLLWRRQRRSGLSPFSSAAGVPTGSLVLPKGSSLASSGPDELSVLCYNIMADAFAHTQRLAAYCTLEVLAWERRLPLILQQIERAQADLVCLQEVDVARLDEVLTSNPWIHQTYKAVAQDTKSKDVICITLFRRDRLQLQWRMSRSRAVMAGLSFIDSTGLAQVVYVANLHLEGSPYRPQDRISQLRNVLAAMQVQQKQLGQDPEAANVVVCGDFNSGPRESVCTLLGSGYLAAGTCEAHVPNVPVTATDLSHPFLLRDVYEAAGRRLPFTRKVPQLASLLDHIYASSHLQVAAVLWSTSPADERYGVGMPNETCPSDHVPVGARLRLLPNLPEYE